MKYLLLGSVVFSFAFPHVSSAQKMPTEGLALYSDYRPHLINFGWIPKKRSYDGWPKQWREVTCGSRLCSAEFISPDRSEKLFISLWPKVGPGKQTVLYLASQFTLDQD